MSSSGRYEEDYANRSDHESIYADSPSDGYFSHRDHPQERFMEHSSVQAESEAKTREATQGSTENSVTAPPSATSPATSSRSLRWADEFTPLLDAGPAPPDYSAATVHRPEEATRHAQAQESAGSGRRLHVGADYGGIGQAGRPASLPVAIAEPEWPVGDRGNPFRSDFPFGPDRRPVTQMDPLSSAIRPQTMRDAHDGEEASHGFGSSRQRHGAYSRRKRTGQNVRRKLLSIPTILMAVVVVGLFIILATGYRYSSQSRTHRNDDRGKGGSGQNDSPNRGDGEGHGGRGSGGGDPDYDNEHPLIPPHLRTPQCPYVSYTETTTMDFAHLRNFSFVELVDESNYFSGGISGLLVVMPAEPDQDADVRVSVGLATTEPWRVTKLNYVKDVAGLQLQAPDVRKVRQRYVGKPCLGIALTIRVRRDVEIGHWRINTHNMNVQIEDGLCGAHGSSSADSTVITTVHGSVKAACWSSRETRVDTVSGSIEGTYALRDLLWLRSRSGSINIRAAPKPADPTAPKPASFVALSQSGSAHVVFPTDDLPDRDYRTRVECSSSSITGTYIHGTATLMTSNAGSITANLLPYTTNITGSTLHTESHSGSTNLRILSPYRKSGTSIKGLRSSHISSSGSLGLTLPPEWQGTINGEVRSGHIDVAGTDLTWYADVPIGSSGRRVVVGRGHGDSRLDFTTNSGNVAIHATGF